MADVESGRGGRRLAAFEIEEAETAPLRGGGGGRSKGKDAKGKGAKQKIVRLKDQPKASDYSPLDDLEADFDEAPRASRQPERPMSEAERARMLREAAESYAVKHASHEARSAKAEEAMEGGSQVCWVMTAIVIVLAIISFSVVKHVSGTMPYQRLPPPPAPLPGGGLEAEQENYMVGVGVPASEEAVGRGAGDQADLMGDYRAEQEGVKERTEAGVDEGFDDHVERKKAAMAAAAAAEHAREREEVEERIKEAKEGARVAHHSFLHSPPAPAHPAAPAPPEEAAGPDADIYEEEVEVVADEHGAVADGETDNTVVLMVALRACANDRKNKGKRCTLVLRQGKYLTGPITLPSHTTLRIQELATLQCSPSPSQYETLDWAEQPSLPAYPPRQHGVHAPCIKAYNATDVRIEGGGKVDGAGIHWRQKELKFEPPVATVYFLGCSHVRMEGVTITDPPMVAVRVQYSDHVSVKEAFFVDDERLEGHDALVVDSSSDVEVRSSHMAVGGAAVRIKSGDGLEGEARAIRTEHVLVTESTVKGGRGVVLDDSMAGGATNISITRINFEGAAISEEGSQWVPIGGKKGRARTDRGGRGATAEVVDGITVLMKRSGLSRASIVRGVRVTDIRGSHMGHVLVVSQHEGGDRKGEYPPELHDLQVARVRVEGAVRAGGLLGLPRGAARGAVGDIEEGAFDGVSLDGINITGLSPKAGWQCEGYVEGVAEGMAPELPPNCVTMIHSAGRR